MGANLCGDHFGFDIPMLSPDWKQFSVDFTQLRQIGFGTRVDFDKTQVINVEFDVHRSVNFDFQVDQLEFY